MEKRDPKQQTRPEASAEVRANACGNDERIKSMIREMPDLDPPGQLLSSVMEAVRAKKVPLWLRAYRWVTSPRSVTFTPLQVIPAMALLLILVMSAFYVYERDTRNVALNRPSRELVPVVFTLNMPQAHSVQVIGSFNNWVPQPCELHKDNGSTRWILTLQLQPGRYEYAFVVDGTPMPDPHAEFYQDDGFGNKNTVLSLEKTDDAI